MSRFAQPALLLSVLLGCVSSAAAFSDYELFALPPLEGGGGGGRYFTTSPIDGYGCGVCHVGGYAPVAQLRGLPEHEYVPGQVYDVEIVWLYPQFPHALNLEFVTPAGLAAGLVTLLPDAELGPEDRCNDPESSGAPAATLIGEAAPRQILSLNHCGSSRLRFRFTAPNDLELTFAASMVRTDRSDKPEGDGVLEIHRVLRAQGYQPSEATSSCSAWSQGARGRSSPQPFTSSVWGGLVLLFGLRRRRSRRLFANESPG